MNAPRACVFPFLAPVIKPKVENKLPFLVWRFIRSEAYSVLGPLPLLKNALKTDTRSGKSIKSTAWPCYFFINNPQLSSPVPCAAILELPKMAYWGSEAKIDLIFIILYFILLIANIPNVFKHGFARSSGYLPLLIVCVRMNPAPPLFSFSLQLEIR